MQSQIVVKPKLKQLSDYFPHSIDLLTVIDAILTGNQSCQKLQCLYVSRNVKILGRRLYISTEFEWYKTGYKTLRAQPPGYKYAKVSSRASIQKIMHTQIQRCKHLQELYSLLYSVWGEGLGSGESDHVPLMWLGFDTGLVSYVGWVCCRFPSCSECFSPGSPVFLPPQKSSISKFQFDPHENQPRLMRFPLLRF